MVCSALAAPLACSTLVVLVEGCRSSTTAQAFCKRFEIGHSHDLWLCPILSWRGLWCLLEASTELLGAS